MTLTAARTTTNTIARTITRLSIPIHNDTQNNTRFDAHTYTRFTQL